MWRSISLPSTPWILQGDYRIKCCGQATIYISTALFRRCYSIYNCYVIETGASAALSVLGSEPLCSTFKITFSSTRIRQLYLYCSWPPSTHLPWDGRQNSGEKENCSGEKKPCDEPQVAQSCSKGNYKRSTNSLSQMLLEIHERDESTWETLKDTNGGFKSGSDRLNARLLSTREVEKNVPMISIRYKNGRTDETSFQVHNMFTIIQYKRKPQLAKSCGVMLHISTTQMLWNREN